MSGLKREKSHLRECGGCSGELCLVTWASAWAGWFEFLPGKVH